MYIYLNQYKICPRIYLFSIFRFPKRTIAPIVKIIVDSTGIEISNIFCVWGFSPESQLNIIDELNIIP